MTEIPVVQSAGCGCNCGGTAALPELDARTIPHAIRHGAILGAVDQLAPGAALVLVAPHNPTPLLAQLDDRWGEQVGVRYLTEGPDVWRLQLTKR